MFFTLKPSPDSWVRRHWLGIVFILAALLTTKLVDLQGQTIERQRWLIKTLSQDSIEMFRLKAKEQQQRGSRPAQTPEQKHDKAEKAAPKPHEDQPQEAAPRGVPLEDPIRAVTAI